MARAGLLWLAGSALLLAASPAYGYICLNGDPCLAGPCYAGQICTTVPSSRGGGLCVAMCSNPQPYVQPQPNPYGGNGGCVACSVADPCSVATCPASSYCIADACRCTWTCSATAPPRPAPTPTPTPTPPPPQPPQPTPPPLPNGGCPANLPYTPCYSDPCAYTGVACPRGAFCQASNCGACRALCVRPSLADVAIKGSADPKAGADAFGPALVPAPQPEQEAAAGAANGIGAPQQVVAANKAMMVAPKEVKAAIPVNAAVNAAAKAPSNKA